MRNTKCTHLISVQGIQYRWRAQGGDESISVGIWPANGIGARIGGSFRYHNTWIDIGGGISTSAGDQIIVTSRLIRRIVEHAIATHNYDPKVKAKQIDLGPLEGVIPWDDAIRAGHPKTKS